MACAFPTIASTHHCSSSAATNQSTLKCFRQPNWTSPMSLNNQNLFSPSSTNKHGSNDQNEEFTKILDFSSLEQDILKNILDDEVEEKEAPQELDTFPSFNYTPAPLPSIFKRINPIMKLYPDENLTLGGSQLKRDGGLLGSLDLPPIPNSFNLKYRVPSQTSNAAMLKAALQRHTIDASWPGINVANHNGHLQRLILPDTIKTHHHHDHKMSDFTYNKEVYSSESMTTRQSKQPTSIAMLLSKLSNNYQNSFSTTNENVFQQQKTTTMDLPQYSYKTQHFPTAIAESVLREDESDFLVHSSPATTTQVLWGDGGGCNSSSRKTFAEIVANARLNNTAR